MREDKVMMDAEVDFHWEKFLTVHANVPLNVRKEVIAVIDCQPFSWKSALIEVENNTETGKKIIEKMEKMGLI